MKQYCLYIVVNDDFTDGAIVTLYSFLKNNAWFNGDIVIGCLDKNGFRLSAENREKIGNLYYKTKFIDIKAEDFYDIFKNMSLRSMRNVGFEMVICKFQIFRMHEYDKVLCIDSDMLIVDDIRELFENDIEFGAAPDKIDEKYGLSCYSERINEYFNSGIKNDYRRIINF